MIIDWLTIDGQDHYRVPVTIYNLVPTQVFGRDAEDHDSAQTHVGFAQIGSETRLLAGYRQTTALSSGKRVTRWTGAH